MDLNCDMGESYGAWQMGDDAALMPFVSSANIACGFHAGDPGTMRRTVRLALKYHVAVGAHPGLPDLQGFGRREMKVSPEEVFDMVLYQLGALHAIAQTEGAHLHHVKPHGALYNMAASERPLADAIAKAVQRFDPKLVLYGLSGSALIEAGAQLGLRTASEAFADRAYLSDGSLCPRNRPGAVFESPEKACEQVLQIIEKQTVDSIDGGSVRLNADTICLHGDGQHALAFAKAIHARLTQKGIIIQAF